MIGPRLQRPPREIPFFLGIQCLFGGVLQQVGWGLLAFGMIFVLLFGAGIDLSKELAFRGDLSRVDGSIKSYQETGAEVNETEVVEYLVEYSVGESTFEDICYTTGYLYEEGDSVKVEFPLDSPEWGRIVGSRVSTFSPWLLLGVGIFPLIGAVMAALGIRQGFVSRSLLSTGMLGQGRLVSKDATSMRVNNQPVYALTFRFRPEGARRDFTTVVKTHITAHLEDDSQEFLLYDRNFPSKTVLLDSLPGKAKITPDGRLTGGGVLETATVLILPFLGLALTLLSFLVLFGD